jgi:serine/threonine-protein kinase
VFRSSVGTPNYTAPEVLQRALYGAKVDIYSYATVFWEMLMGKVPFQDFNSNQIIEHVALLNLRLPLPEKRKPLGKCITKCRSKDPAERPVFAEIMR